MTRWSGLYMKEVEKKSLYSRRGPAACNLNPFCQAASLFPFDVDDVCITSAMTTHSVFFDVIK